jgi:acetolactate synthase small subunit
MPEMILALKIRNHPAAIARIAGLFVRRAYSLSGMVCRPDNDNRTGRMYLMMPDDSQFSQVVKNLEKHL